MANDPETQELENNLTALEDITVDTMGLVERGAVGETFFLLKHQHGGIMADEIEGLEIDEEVIKEEISPSFLERLGRQRLLGWLSKMQETEGETEQPPIDETPPPVETEKAKDETKKALSGGAKRGVMALIREYGGELPPNVVGMLRGLLGDSDDDKEKTQKDDEVKTMAEEREVKKEIVEEPQVKQVEKAAEVSTPPVTDPALLARLEKAEKANEAILARLEKSEADLQKARLLAQQEREARQRITFIEKAREFDVLPAQAEELGGFLHRLAKADETANIEKSEDAADRRKDFEYLTGLLKAANEQLKQAGFFAEAGTTKDPGDMDLIDKAAALVEKGDYQSLKDALLHVSPDDAEKYLGQFKGKN